MSDGMMTQSRSKPAADPSPSSDQYWMTSESGWQGPTYYGRPQVKAAPFNNWVVGSYIFLAGLSGSSALISAIAEQSLGEDARDTVRRGRYLSMLAPTVGSGLLIYDLHTPHRFYNMLRIAKSTSPMSIGTWNLMSFSALAFSTASAQALLDIFPGVAWLKTGAAVAQVPAAIAGAGLSTYTAALLSSTSTPTWAAAPRSLAVRFGASSVASAAAALSLTERSPRVRRKLDMLAVAALATELVAAAVESRTQSRKGVSRAMDSRWGALQRNGATGVGALLPLGLYAASLALRRDRASGLSRLASLAVLAGSALLRVSTMGVGDESASRPEISFRFSQPENLPKDVPRNRIGIRGGARRPPY